MQYYLLILPCMIISRTCFRRLGRSTDPGKRRRAAGVLQYFCALGEITLVDFPSCRTARSNQTVDGLDCQNSCVFCYFPVCARWQFIFCCIKSAIELHSIPQCTVPFLETLSQSETPLCTRTQYSGTPRTRVRILITITEKFHNSQGCGKALIGAVLLDKILRSTVSDTFNKVDLSKKYFQEHKKKLESAWLVEILPIHFGRTDLRIYRDGTKSIDYGFSTTIPVKGETLESEGVQRQVL